jgi:hypothetical protein
MQGFDAPVLCDATADVLRTALHVQVTRVRRNRPVRVGAAAFAPQRVRSKVESLRALHQNTNVQRRLALHAAPATRVARPAPVGPLPFVESLQTLRARAAAFASAYAAFATRRATVESLRRFTCRCNGTRAETIAASRPAVVRCDATVEAQVRGPPVPLSDRFVQSTQIAAPPLPT